MSEDFVFFFVTLEILKCCRTVSLKRQFKSNKEKGENRRKPDEREKGKEDGKKEDRQKKKRKNNKT